MEQYISKINEDENIAQALDDEVVYLNQRQEDFDRINKSYRVLSNKNFNVLINKIEYRIGSLINAHNFSNVANQDEVEKDTAELNQYVSELNNEILDIENIGSEMGTNYKEPKYQDLSDRIHNIINESLNSCNETVRKATDVLSHKFDSVDSKIDIEESFEYPVDEIDSTEIKTDSIEDLEEELSRDLQPIQESKKELEVVKNDLDEAVKVTNIEPAPEATISPVLMPETNLDLNTFLNKEENKVEDNKINQFPVAEVKPNEIKSASNVDEGPVLVTNVETFDLNENRVDEGPTLSRVA